jgi:hypothetical protein
MLVSMIPSLMRSIISVGVCVALAVWSSCSLFQSAPPLVRPYNSYNSTIRVPPPTPELSTLFSRSSIGRLDSVQKPDGATLHGYVTKNREFFQEVLEPILSPHLGELSNQHPVQIINTLTLVSHEAYQKYFGNNFYRWGGDILDLDDPQEEGVRHEYAYGLDCSGFVSMPYEMGVLLGLLDPSSDAALFSSQGFTRYAEAHNIPDLGGRLSTSNRYRLDTQDLLRLGREIFLIDSGAAPSPYQVSLLQPGDIVGTTGHVGIVVEIEGDLYYVESGGWVMQESGGNPDRAEEALAIFARQGPLTIRRALPDYHTRAAR